MWGDDTFVGFDFETSGELPEYALQPWRYRTGKAWPTSFVAARRAGPSWDVRRRMFPDPAFLRDILTEGVESGWTFVGWNSPFDIAWLLAAGLEDLVMRARWLDGMRLWRHVFLEPEYDEDRSKKKSYGLKSCVEELYPEMAGYEEDIDFHSTDAASLAKLEAYNIRDVLHTVRCSKHWYQELEKEPRRLRAALIEAQCLPLIAKANLEGMPVDRIYTHHLSVTLTKTAEDRLAQLSPHGITEKIVRSPMQLSKLMFDDWGLPVLKENTSDKTGKTSRSTDKEVLHELAFIDPRAKLVREYREALNLKTKFPDALLESASYNEDNRTRPEAIIFGTYSGRLTYASKQGRNKDERQTGFALHQLKRGTVFREPITAPEGYDVVEFDAAGQEFRWMAIASRDQTMLNLCMPGEDPHSYMGAQIAGRDYKGMIVAVKEGQSTAKSSRQLGKVANLSLQYRTSAVKLRVVARVDYNIPMELPEAQMIHATYKRVYPGVPQYWQIQIAETKRLGYVETFAHRRVQVLGDWTRSMGWKMGSTAINYRIQGTGADQKYLALACLRPLMVKLGAFFAWDLHDGIYFFVPKAVSRAFAVEGKRVLDTLPYKQAWGFTPPIPMPWDCKIGPTWGTLKEFVE